MRLVSFSSCFTATFSTFTSDSSSSDDSIVPTSSIIKSSEIVGLDTMFFSSLCSCLTATKSTFTSDSSSSDDSIVPTSSIIQSSHIVGLETVEAGSILVLCSEVLASSFFSVLLIFNFTSQSSSSVDPIVPKSSIIQSSDIVGLDTMCLVSFSSCLTATLSTPM